MKNGHHQVVSEYCEGGDFLAKIKDNFIMEDGKKVADPDKAFTEDQIVTWFTQLCLAIEETHSLEMTHRNFDASHIYARNIAKCQ